MIRGSLANRGLQPLGHLNGGTFDVVGARIGQERHDRKQLDERAGPAVRQDQRNASPVCGPLMDEVNADAVVSLVL